MLTRRHLLSHAAALAGASALPSLAAPLAGGDYRALVCVFLYGGNDGNNMVVPTDAEGVRLVEEGRVDAFAQDDILLYGLIAASPAKDRLHVTGRHLTVEPYAFMLPKDDVPLREIVDRTVLSLMHSGELAAIYRKWFDTASLRIPMSAHMRENIRYPNKYGIP